MKSLQSIFINRRNAFLMIVDAQNEFCKPGGKRYTETSARVAPGVVRAIQGLSEQIRSAGIPIIYIQSVRTHLEPEFTVFGYQPILKKGSWGANIVDELKPREGDIVVQKSCHDPFYKTELEQVLSRLVPDPTKYYALVAGGSVNVCLYHATMGLHLRNYWTVVLVDSVFYRNEVVYPRAIEQFSEPAYPNIFLSRSDLVKISDDPAVTLPALKPGT